MNKSTILAIFGSIGVVATTISAVKATPKALRRIEDAEKEKGEELTKLEKFKHAAPAYIPTAIIGASTIACIVGANMLNTKSQASIASAYALIDHSYNEYKKKVGELYGEEAEQNVVKEIARDEYDGYIPEEDEQEGDQLFFDFNAMRYFKSSMDRVVQETVMDDGTVCYIISTPYEPPIFQW